MKKTLDSEYTPEEAAKRADETLRRLLTTPHTPRKAVAPQTVRGKAQRKWRAKASPRSR